MSWTHLAHAAHHEEKRGNHKLAGVGFLVIGFFLAPALIGIPMMMYGLYQLCK